jgi:DNA-binding XRE family transcriptional regulator
VIIIERRFDVKLISPEALRSYMLFRDFTIRSLAEKVGCSHATIGFLVKGTRTTCRPTTARSIAKALNCPVDALFMARTSTVQREVARPRSKAA